MPTILIYFTVTNELAAGSWYCRSNASTGSCTKGRVFILLLMCTKSSMTFFRTPSCCDDNLSKTGGKNFDTTFCNCSSVSADPTRRKTRSRSTGKLH